MVGIHAMLQLVINRSNPQFTFERAEHRLDLCQLHIAGQKHRRVAVGQISTAANRVHRATRPACACPGPPETKGTSSSANRVTNWELYLTLIGGGMPLELGGGKTLLGCKNSPPNRGAPIGR